MNRLFGMMPSSEITISKRYLDQHGLKIRIDAGPHGWTVNWADGGNTYKDEDNEDAVNFQHALDLVKSKGFELTEDKSPRMVVCKAHEDTLEGKIEKWFESGLGDIGFHPLHADLSQTKPNLFTVEVRGSFAPYTPWFNSEFLLKLSNRLDAMVEMNGNEELEVDGILESPELFWIVPDPEDPKFFRMLFKVKYVPNQTSAETAGEA